RLGPYLPRCDATRLGPGDDAAVVAAADGRFVVTTDVQVQDRHFRREWSTGTEVGRRAATVNFADVAAMGARPTALVTALVLPAEVEVDWVLQLADGLGQECRRWGAGAVGGDLSGGPVITVSVTAHGDLQGRAPVLRGPAPGSPRPARAAAPRRDGPGSAPACPPLPSNQARPRCGPTCARTPRWRPAPPPLRPGRGPCWISVTACCAMPAVWPQPRTCAWTWTGRCSTVPPRNWWHRPAPAAKIRSAGFSAGERTTGCWRPSLRRRYCHRSSHRSAGWRPVPPG